MMRSTYFFALSVCMGVMLSFSSKAQDFSAYWPKHNAYTEQFSPEFQWNSVPGATGYVWRIANNLSMLNPIDVVNTSSLSTFPSSSLTYGLWYWQVEAVLPVGSVFTQVYALRVFDPSQAADLALWLKADAGLTLDANGRVQIWQDLSPAGLQFSQTTDTKRPWPNVPGMSGLPSLQFSGGQVLDGGNVLNIGTNSRAMFLVGQMTGSNQAFYAKSIAAGQPNRYGLLRDGIQNTFLYQDNAARNIVSATVSNGFAFYSALANRSTSQNSFMLNNSVLGANSISNNHNLSSTFRFLIGAYNNSTDAGEILFLNGNINEMVFVNTHVPSVIENIQNYLRYKYNPPINLGPDIRVAYGFCNTSVTAPAGFTSHQWSTGATTESITVNQPGTYWVQVTDIFGFTSSDTIVVNYPEIDTPAFAAYCPGSSVTWNANLGPHYTYAWSTGETTESIVIDTPGSYYVTVTDTNGCSKTFPAIEFEEDAYSTTVSLGPDVDLCNGNAISLVSGADETVAYAWNTGATDSSIVVSTSGTYSVTTTNANGCEAYDEVQVTIVGDAPVVSIGMQPAYCQGLEFTYTDNSVTTDGSSIVSRNWQFGDGGVSTCLPGIMPTPTTAL
jgi:hypothetical protein